MLSVTTKTQKVVAATLGAFLFLGATTAGDEKHLSIYSSVATYTLPVTDRLGNEYIGLLEVLEPLGRISARVDGQHWKMRFNNTDGDFVAGRATAKVRGRELDLGAPFIIENSRGLVPLSSLSAVLPGFLGNPVNLRETARRLLPRINEWSADRALRPRAEAGVALLAQIGTDVALMVLNVLATKARHKRVQKKAAEFIASAQRAHDQATF